MRRSGTVTEIWRLKDNGVTSLTFLGHVMSSVTERKMEEGKNKKEGGREEKGKMEGEKKGKGEGEKERKIKGREGK